uniref:RBR-type E3 ubiquitin transferase n=1 Tax=Paramoeba aestuarina TaxID=180227 RepID=A0A7S4NX23_9EUKA|mmetsp:Transcript_30111/g.46667  ORF Transcript_30111/g.46667 Transcript_30111/m.46667 type:complete len:448 (+) Transcript_30111:266-1609(+)|eukprot:CAMPEP_0201510246 /NCGR_PEP_ID=MMETSP0161_2-20130828/3016_1 /ASSEMBLY_ACC=CAM_ASM_000251 /TAXON_ID=180227 /ORGANISM="Neoparamoeba aestuarina, Strain SoJaBio B1-5/56/2" /LENGTH=447 /DNA_ID=CAMNT_0047905393 /DNA_START=253 /DNA_END=1596 /DNA_ORIENTATION=-
MAGGTLTGSAFIPYANTTLDALTRLDGSDSRPVEVTLNGLEELKHNTELVVERCLERGEEDRIPLLFSIHERIDLLISNLEKNANNQEVEVDFGDDNVSIRLSASTGPGLNHSGLDDSFEMLLFSSDDDSPETERRGRLKEEEEEEEEDWETMECLICYGDYSKDETYKLGCKHRYCLGCLDTYINSLIGIVDAEIICPDPECRKVISRDDMRSIVGEKTLEKYDRFVVLSLLRKEQSTRWCPKCEAPFSGEPPAGQVKITCFECQTDFCYNCKDVWHEGKTCGEYQRANPADRKTRQWMKRQGVQNCPHCGLPTIRSTGCLDMKCVNCGKHWRWEGDANETVLEKVAYFYPRSVSYIATSREAHEHDEGMLDELRTNLAVGLFAAVVLSPALLVTIPTIIPAIAVTAGRKTKEGVTNFFISLFGSSGDDEELGEEGKGKGKESEKN